MTSPEDYDNLDFLEIEREDERASHLAGLEAGITKSKTKSYEDGFKHGLENGYLVGREVGHYYGCALVWSAVLRSMASADSKIVRLKKALAQLLILAEQTTLCRASPSIEANVDSLRSKFKQVQALMSRLSQNALEEKATPRAQDLTF